MEATPLVNGHWAMAAATGTSAAVLSTWPPPKDVPHSATRSASVSGRLRAYATAALQSSRCRGTERSWRGCPLLAPKWR